MAIGSKAEQVMIKYEPISYMRTIRKYQLKEIVPLADSLTTPFSRWSSLESFVAGLMRS